MDKRAVPRRTLDEVLIPKPRLRRIDLSAAATIAFFTFRGSHKRVYGLLHKSGSFIATQDGPVTTDNWAQAVRLANAHACDFIAIYHRESIRHRYTTANHAEIWERAVIYPHESTIETLLCAVDAYKDADEYGRSRSSLRRATRRKQRRAEVDQQATRNKLEREANEYKEQNR